MAINILTNLDHNWLTVGSDELINDLAKEMNNYRCKVAEDVQLAHTYRSDIMRSVFIQRLFHHPVGTSPEYRHAQAHRQTVSRQRTLDEALDQDSNDPHTQAQ